MCEISSYTVFDYHSSNTSNWLIKVGARWSSQCGWHMIGQLYRQISSSFTTYMISLDPSSHTSSLPPPLPTSNSICTCSPPFIPSPLPPPPLFLSLQLYGETALMEASAKGHTDAIKTLLAVPGVDVNHANVSLFSLTSTLPLFLPPSPTSNHLYM